MVECSYSSFEAVADERVGRFIPSIAAKILVKEGLLYTDLRYGLNLSRARPDLAVRHAHVPTLLIYGLADSETSPEHSRRLAQANPTFTKLWLVPGARHTRQFPKSLKKKFFSGFMRRSVKFFQLF